MATSKKSWKKSLRIQELVGIVLLFAALIAIMSLLSYDPGDPTWFSRQTDAGPRSNWVGWAGATLSEALLQLLGTSAWLIPVFLAVAGWSRLRRPTEPFAVGTAFGLAGLTLSLAALTDLLFRSIAWGGEEFEHAGGYLGKLASRTAACAVQPPRRHCLLRHAGSGHYRPGHTGLFLPAARSSDHRFQPAVAGNPQPVHRT